MRKVIYLLAFLFNIFRCFNKKLGIPKLQVWVGQKCSLRCKNCSQLFPYIEQRVYDINEVINNLKILLNFVKPEEIHIIGGEPFCNKNIGKLIEFICKVNPNKPNKIISNGTIIPNNEIINLLSKNCDNIYITISQYPIIKDRQEKFYKTLKEYGVVVEYVKTEDYWYYIGDNKQKEIKGYKNLKNNFNLCWDKTCNTLADGILSLCPRMHNSKMIKWSEGFENVIFFEHLPIQKIPNNFIGRALVAACLTTKTYRESCKHCWGLSMASNIKVKKAEQLKEEVN